MSVTLHPSLSVIRLCKGGCGAANVGGGGISKAWDCVTFGSAGDESTRVEPCQRVNRMAALEMEWYSSWSSYSTNYDRVEEDFKGNTSVSFSQSNQ